MSTTAIIICALAVYGLTWLVHWATRATKDTTRLDRWLFWIALVAVIVVIVEAFYSVVVKIIQAV
jgi:t-SNARE complex subunit (syntaxin)